MIQRRFIYILMLFMANMMIGCSPCNHEVLKCNSKASSVAEEEAVTFLLMFSEEEVVVPSRLQKILVEKLSNPENRKRFPKTLLMPIGHFYINGKKWEWCGGRLYSPGDGYYYISELDPPKSRSLYKYTRKYIPKEKRNTPEYAIRLKKLRNEVKQHFNIYN